MTDSTEFPRGFPRKLEGVVGKRAGNTERKPGRVREETLGQAKAAQLENGGGREAAAERLVEQQVDFLIRTRTF